MSLSGNNALLLNANFRPMSYFPLSLVSWQNAVKAVFLDRVNILSEYDIEVRSQSFKMKIPSVISLKEYVHYHSSPTFNRFNVFLRDDFCCQYCRKQFPLKELTFDHVVPKYKNGKTSWDNVVTACTSCNFRKGHNSLKESKMSLACLPREPSIRELQKMVKHYPPTFIHKSWSSYLQWDC